MQAYWHVPWPQSQRIPNCVQCVDLNMACQSDLIQGSASVGRRGLCVCACVHVCVHAQYEKSACTGSPATSAVSVTAQVVHCYCCWCYCVTVLSGAAEWGGNRTRLPALVQTELRSGLIHEVPWGLPKPETVTTHLAHPSACDSRLHHWSWWVM